MMLHVVTRVVPLSSKWASEAICSFIRVVEYAESDVYSTRTLVSPPVMKATLVGVSVI